MKKIFTVILAFAALFFTSCDDKIMGYSVVLWNVPEIGLQGGDVVPVYIKSNISHVYIIGLENGEKSEVPLWQLSDPVKKSKINGMAQKYAEHAHTYASVKSDGLPSRAEPVNTAKQVYRLRKGEVIKILYKGKGQAPMTGGKPLEGDWYKILTSNGTQGWCFSYNLNLYEVDETGNKIGGEDIVEEEDNDTTMDYVISKVWYPDSFDRMIKNQNIDLNQLHPSYNFSIDVENSKVNLNTRTIHESWTYSGFTKTDEKQYTLNNIPIVVIYKKSNFIVVRYTGENGKPQELDFVLIDQDLNEVIKAEKDRCSEAYLQVFTHGPVYNSSNYGRLTFEEAGTFKWSNFKLLVPSVIPAGTKSYGTVSVKYSISKKLKENYDGVLTFKFEGLNEPVNFLYKLENGNLRLEDATSAKFDGNQLKERGAGSVVMFFQRYR